MSLRVLSLFTGIGGLELGIHQSGGRTVLMAESDASCRRLLQERFPDIPIVHDVRDVCRTVDPPDFDMIVAGFPCQDLSVAGRRAGLAGSRSSLFFEVVRIARARQPEWIVLENVYGLLTTRGAMGAVTDALSSAGYRWAYRVLDGRNWLPQRRVRVVIVATRTQNPDQVLFRGDLDDHPNPTEWPEGVPCSFLISEGRTGLGWNVNSFSTICRNQWLGCIIPPDNDRPGRPSTRDLERLAGFEPGWTASLGSRTHRKMKLGNSAVPAMMAWVMHGVLNPNRSVAKISCLRTNGSWSPAGTGGPVESNRVLRIGDLPTGQRVPLAGYLHDDLISVSDRAIRGFLSRAGRSRLRFPDGFLDYLRAHLGDL